MRCSINSAKQNKMPTYLSYHTQNEFIVLVGDKIRSKIMDEIREAKCYGILSDGNPRRFSRRPFKCL